MKPLAFAFVSFFTGFLGSGFTSDGSLPSGAIPPFLSSIHVSLSSSLRIVTLFWPPSRKPPIPRADDVRKEACPTWKAPAAVLERARIASVDFMVVGNGWYWLCCFFLMRVFVVIVDMNMKCWCQVVVMTMTKKRSRAWKNNINPPPCFLGLWLRNRLSAAAHKLILWLLLRLPIHDDR